jgi:hypothetical protein
MGIGEIQQHYMCSKVFQFELSMFKLYDETLSITIIGIW